MGKGVVKGIGSGSSGGTLIITDPTGGSGTVGASSAATSLEDVGLEIAFTLSGITASAGDEVSFEIPATGGSANVTAKTGVKAMVISGIYSNPIKLAAGQIAFIQAGATVDGKITGNGSIILVDENCTVDSKIDIDNGSIITVATGGKISGKIDSSGNNTVILSGCLIDSKVTSSNDKYIKVVGCTVNGNVKVANVGSCTFKGNTVNGTIDAPGCYP
jgi:hypothetical protein